MGYGQSTKEETEEAERDYFSSSSPRRRTSGGDPNEEKNKERTQSNQIAAVIQLAAVRLHPKGLQERRHIRPIPDKNQEGLGNQPAARTVAAASKRWRENAGLN